MSDVKRFGSSVPRYGVWRKGNFSFYPQVEKFVEKYGLTPFPWQVDVLKAVYAVNRWRDESGVMRWEWANPIVCVSAGRQCGKGRLAEIVELADLALFGASSVLHTSQGASNSNNSWSKMNSLIEAFKSYDDGLFAVDPTGSTGREMFRFRGRRMSNKALPEDYDPKKVNVFRSEKQYIRYITRTESKMMGASVDTLVIDEAQTLTKRMWNEVQPTLAARPFSRALLIGNPPTNRREEQFHLYRSMALKAIEDGVEESLPFAWFEWSAPKDADPSDPDVWAAAFPGLNYSIPETGALSLQYYWESMALDDFKLWWLGMWYADTSEWVIPLPIWSAQRNENDGDVEYRKDPFDSLVIGVDTDYLGKHSCVSLAWRTVDGEYKTTVLAADEGTDWVAEYVYDATQKQDIKAVVCDKYSRVNDLAYEFEELGIELTVTQWDDLVLACDLFDSGIRGGWLWHANDAILNLAVEGATWKVNHEGGGRRWDRKKSTSPIYALMASTLAVWGARMENDNPSKLVPVRGRVDKWASRRGKIIIGQRSF